MDTPTFGTNFKWSVPHSYDDLFAMSSFYDAKEGEYLELYDKEAVPGVVQYGKTYHPDYHCLIRAASNYFGIAGKVMSSFFWEESQDADIEYLQANLDNAPLPYEEYCEPLLFDFDNRVISRVLDLTIRPKNVWLQNTVPWNLDMRSRFEAYEDGLALACILSPSIREWNDKIIILEKGNEIEITKDEGCRTTYVIPFNNDVFCNDAPLNRMEAANFTESGTVKITAINETVIAWRTQLPEGQHAW